MSEGEGYDREQRECFMMAYCIIAFQDAISENIISAKIFGYFYS